MSSVQAARPLPDLRSRYLSVYTGLLVDVLDHMGYPTQTLPHELTPLTRGMRVAGPAFTVEGRPRAGIDFERSIRKILTMLGEAPTGHVLVYQTHDTETAHLGELSVTALLTKGCAGAIIDGGCRDIEYILQSDFPVFSRYTTPQDCVPRWELTSTGEPITIGAVRISRGDFVVGDMDGIVVVPAAITAEVISAAEVKMGTESRVREAVRQGVAPLAAFEENGAF